MQHDMLLPRSDFYTPTMVSLGAAVPALAPLHTSIVSQAQIVHGPAYFVRAIHVQCTGLELHCEHLSGQ